MKKLTFVIVLISSLVSCKKETTNTNSTTNSSNGVTCIDNPNINFTSIGTPIGKFSDCIKDIDGNVYKTVTIGTQTWMAENLKTSKYRDGAIIPNITDDTQWSKLSTGAWCYYNNDSVNNAKYGKLYNWYALSKTTNGNKDVCPSGWHVPTDAEWTVLTDYLGGASVAGGKMKEVGTTNWNNPNTDAMNTSLFTALPGGQRDGSIGLFGNVGINGRYWSSSEYSPGNVWYRNFTNFLNSVGRTNFDKKSGFTVRCLKD